LIHINEVFWQQNNMRIGIDWSRAQKKNKTGTEWYSFYLIKTLHTFQISDEIILYSPQDIPSEYNINKFKVNILKWPFVYLWTHIRLSWEMLTNPPDVLFVPAHSVPLIHRQRTIVTIHDLGFLHFPEIYKPLARWYHRISAWWSITKSKKIITISEFTKQDILNYYHIPAEKVTVIPLAVNISDMQINYKDESILAKYNIHKPYFLFVGRIEKKKNIQTLLAAWQEFKKNNTGYQLVLIGPDGYGTEIFNTQIKNDCDILKIGYVSEYDKTLLLRQAIAFIFPSLFEGFGMPLLEAFAAHCPVLCARSTALPEVGADACLYFTPTDFKELVKSMEQIIHDNVLRDKLIIAGSRRLNDFSWEKTAQKTLSILSKI
jgi:glycosyltransferase involved in cell wall biosynthesis